MDKIEVLHFMQKIKAYYQNFAIEEYIVNEWHDRLKNYDVDDVYMKFEQHLKGEYKNEIPKLHFITKYLKTTNEKINSKPSCVLCGKCKKQLNLSDYDQHISRHNSVEYLLKKSEKFNIAIGYDETQLFNLDEETFNELYDAFVEELYEVETDELQKRILKRMICLKKGMPVNESEFQMDLNLFKGGIN